MGIVPGLLGQCGVIKSNFKLILKLWHNKIGECVVYRVNARHVHLPKLAHLHRTRFKVIKQTRASGTAKQREAAMHEENQDMAKCRTHSNVQSKFMWTRWKQNETVHNYAHESLFLSSAHCVCVCNVQMCMHRTHCTNISNRTSSLILPRASEWINMQTFFNE